MQAKLGVDSNVKREIRKWIIQSALGIIVFGLILFLAAGRLDWIWGWLILVVTALFLAAHPIILIPINPELLIEREKGFRQGNVKRWDRWLGPAAGGMFFLVWIVAALDYRFDWTGPISLVYNFTGLGFHVAGYGLFLWAMASNAFFAESVRIQSERGHTVAVNGPYRIVRHPGYAGAIIGLLSTPFLLGSVWAMIPAMIGIGLYIARTYMEDMFLFLELPGYTDYARRIRYRLLPGIW